MPITPTQMTDAELIRYADIHDDAYLKEMAHRLSKLRKLIEEEWVEEAMKRTDMPRFDAFIRDYV